MNRLLALLMFFGLVAQGVDKLDLPPTDDPNSTQAQLWHALDNNPMGVVDIKGEGYRISDGNSAVTCKHKGDEYSCSFKKYSCTCPAGKTFRNGKCGDSKFACPRIYDPVCGCDDNTYSNSCFAGAAGVRKWTKGPCKTGKETACLCPKGMSYLDGECTTLKFACPRIYDPVCGCDGNTYGNNCEARAKGVKKYKPGEC